MVGSSGIFLREWSAVCILSEYLISHILQTCNPTPVWSTCTFEPNRMKTVRDSTDSIDTRQAVDGGAIRSVTLGNERTTMPQMYPAFGMAQRIWRKQPQSKCVYVDLGRKVEKLLTFLADEGDWQLAGLPARATMCVCVCVFWGKISACNWDVCLFRRTVMTRSFTVALA